MARASQREISGFTLTELLVVLLLIGIFTGVMLAEMRGSFEDALLRSTAREVMGGLGLASSKAVSLNQPCHFEWDPAGHGFTVRPRSTTSSESAEPFESRKLDDRVTVEIRDSATTSDERSEPARDSEKPPAQKANIIEFFPDGTADRREIIFRDSNNGELLLQINPVTARVRVLEGEPAR